MIKPNKRTLYFFKVTGTCSLWEGFFYQLYEASGELEKARLFNAYPELAMAWNEWFLQGDDYFKEFRR
jgi:hypothetical protein